MTAKKAAGHAHKHVASSKHHGTSKHSPSGSKKSPAGHKTAKVTTKGKHPAHAKARGFAVGDLLPVCALEAVAQWLRLAGQPVSGDEVAWLWELLGEPAEGVSVGDALAATARFGLGGQKPRWLPALHPLAARGTVVADAEGGIDSADEARRGIQPHAELQAHRLGEDAHVVLADLPDGLGMVPGALLDEFVSLSQRALSVHSLILGVDVPGPHAVLATSDGWWSWGELRDPWPCRIDEAWAVSW